MKNLFFNLFLLSIFTISAQDPVTYAIANNTIESIGDELRESVNSIDNLKTNTIGDGANAILTIIGRLKEDMGSIIDKADRTISKRQNAILNNIVDLKASLDNTIETGLQDVERIILLASQTIDDFWGKDNEPIIVNILTEPYIKGITKSQRLKFLGKNFQRADTIYLELSNTKIAYDTRTFSKLEFEIPEISLDSSVENQKYIKGKIYSKWRKGLFKKKKSRVDPFIIPIFPKIVGAVKVIYEQNRPFKRLLPQMKYEVPDCTTGSRKPGRSRPKSSKSFNINPSDGEKRIYVPSIKFENWYQRYGGSPYWTTRTEQQIKGYITCKAERKAYGGGGKSTVDIIYREYEQMYPVRDFETDINQINAFNPLILKLPRPIDGYSARVNYAVIETYDGKNITLIPNGNDRFFSLQHNQDTDDVIIKFKNN